MKKQIKDLLAKYSYIEFTNQNDKEIFIDFLTKLSNEIDENNQEDVFSISAGIFGKGLNNFHEIELIEKIKKLN